MYSGQPLYEQGPFSSFTSWDTQLFHRQQGRMVRDTLMLHVMQISIFVLYASVILYVHKNSWCCLLICCILILSIFMTSSPVTDTVTHVYLKNTSRCSLLANRKHKNHINKVWSLLRFSDLSTFVELQQVWHVKTDQTHENNLYSDLSYMRWMMTAHLYWRLHQL